MSVPETRTHVSLGPFDRMQGANRENKTIIVFGEQAVSRLELLYEILYKTISKGK